MTTVAVVPVKPLRRGKSRLAPVLSVQARARINRYLLTHTLEVLRQVPEIERVLVVSRDSAVLALAREYGAHTLQERGDLQLNDALQRAMALLRAWAVSAALVLPADLPLLQKDDVQALLAALPPPPAVVIAPNASGNGTNALVMSPPGLIGFAYGADSFARHLASAQQVNAHVAVVERPGLQADLDYPHDLAMLQDVFPEYAARDQNLLAADNPPSL